MLYIDMNNKNYQYEIQELIKLFVKPSSFSFTNEVIENNCPDDVYLTIDIVLEDKLKIDIGLKSKNRNHKSGATAGAIGGEPLNKKIVKDFIKRTVFSFLSKHYRYYPPWGILTGVRPSKIVNEMLDKGISDVKIIERLKDYYCIQDEKIELLMSVAKKERPFLESCLDNSVSLYIGIPFCPSRCIYCSFTSYIGNESQMNRYLQALKKEIHYVGQEIQKSHKKIESIYIGGGTPTSLYAHQLDDLLESIEASFNLEDLKEYTVECGRPDTITEEKLITLKKYKVDRISINPQSMKDETLRLIGRKHNAEDIKTVFHMAQKIGFKSINADLIAGLPEETPEDLKKSLEELILLNPENITVHTLAIKKSSKLRENREQYEYSKEENVKEMLRASAEILSKEGYAPYYMYRQKFIFGNLENVGYTKPSHEGIYNIMIIEEKQSIIALGAGAVSKAFYKDENRFERVANVSNYEIYIERIDDMIDKKRKMLFQNIDSEKLNTYN